MQENYDEQGQLTLAYITTTPGTIDGHNWWTAQTDALGHRMYHERQAVLGNAYPLIYETTDGLRPETVMDYQYSVLSGVHTFQGYRDYVLGPDPDEYLAFRDFDANQTLYYPHIDKEGSVIALSSAGTVAQKYAYDVYGQSSAGVVDVGPGPASYPFLYTGQRLDPTTAFYNYKARDYAPALGRFLQPDPAGVDQGPNLYEYVGDDPVNRTDPTGLASCGPGMSSSDCDSAMKSQTAALKDVKALRQDLKQLRTEQKAVAAGSQKSLSAGATATQNALQKFYGGSDDKVIGTVDKQASQVQSVLSSNSYVFLSNPFDKSNFGQTVPGVPVIALGKPFFSTSDRNREVTELHEPRHIFGANVFHPEAYEGRASGLPQPYAFDNADTFAVFTYDLTHP